MPDPGWYDDPEATGGARWWDGLQWTEQVRTKTELAPPPDGTQRILGSPPMTQPVTVIGEPPTDSGWTAPARYGLVSATRRCLTGIIDFRSRASRSEYWYFLLGQYLLLLVPAFAFAWVTDLFIQSDSVVFAILGTVASFVLVVGYLALQLALLAVSVRRVHDMNLRGWWVIVPIFNPFGFIRAGTPGPNRFG